MDTDGWQSDDEHSTEWRGPTAVRIYDGVSFLGFFALLLTLLPATLSKPVHRTRPWYSFIASWMVFAFSFLLLVNNQIEDTPHFGTCVLQMVMVYSSPVLQSGDHRRGIYHGYDLYFSRSRIRDDQLFACLPGPCTSARSLKDCKRGVDEDFPT
ncbi:hypothetical protein BDZ89DRAFT_456013 [Hymenopellis radicata]|nr:hypothetical protein BDZ89DRAFT_456013 [Hymenopellis radicata]